MAFHEEDYRTAGNDSHFVYHDQPRREPRKELPKDPPLMMLWASGFCIGAATMIVLELLISWIMAQMAG